MPLTKTICTSILLAISVLAQGQEPEQRLSDFAGKFIISQRAQSKAHTFVITDKQVYTPGESIWFKASLIDPNTLQPDARTHFLFVDLVNDKDSLIAISILDVPARQVNARFVLTDSIRTGYYWLRAYTRKMAEKDPGSISLIPIVIMGKEPLPPPMPRKDRAASDSILLSYFPEGGTIMPGEISVVGLQATDGNGQPISVEGDIRDNRDSIITKFYTNEFGLGKFELNASGYRRYRAVINRQGRSRTFPLPSYNYRRGQIAISRSSGRYNLRVLLGDSIYSKDAISYILAVSKDSLIFASIGKGQYATVMEEGQVTGGICTFYLFDKDFQLLSERSIYVPEKSNFKLSTDKAVYSPREQITLTIGTTDAAHQPLTALVSITVADSSLQQLTNTCNSKPFANDLSNMVLVQNNCLADSTIDLFMLVRPQTYSSIVSTNDSIVPDLDSLLFIKGKIVNQNDEAQDNATVTLRSSTGKTLGNPYTTGSSGFFRFPLDSYADSTQFLIHVESSNGKTKNNKVILQQPSYPKLVTPLWMKESLRVTRPLLKPFQPKQYDSILMKNDKDLLSKATVRGRKKPANYDVSKRYSNSSVVLASDVINERTSVGSAIMNVGGIQMLNGFLVMAGPTGLNPPDRNSEPLVVVNGVAVSPPDDMRGTSPTLSYLNSIQPQEVEFVEILKGPEAANFGMRGGNGVIVVNLAKTRKGPDAELLNFKVYFAKGVANPAPFPNIRYNEKASKNSDVNDNRTTLYWNSELLTGVTPEKVVAFFAGDRPGTYQIIVKGIGAHRELIYKTVSFLVK